MLMHNVGDPQKLLWRVSLIPGEYTKSLCGVEAWAPTTKAAM